MANDFRCDYCGQFISYADLDDGAAECYMLTPDSEISTETYATHHYSCYYTERKKEKQRQAKYEDKL